MRIALGIEYDGRPFNGWQSQPEGQTVQDYLETALEQFTGSRLLAVCAGRTDSNVHASGQVVHVDTPCSRTPVSWVRGLNSYLPTSIAVRWAHEVNEDFHARFSAISRTYEYWIANEAVRSPLLAGRTGWVFRPLDIQAMNEGALCLLGEHDFSSFRAAGCQAKSPIKILHELSIDRRGRLIRIRLRANAFLYHMVRNIVGTLVYVGTHRQEPDWVKMVLEAKSRTVAAPTFFPSGLYLTGVEYPDSFGVPQFGPSPFDFE